MMFFISPIIAGLILIREIDFKKVLPFKFDPGDIQANVRLY